MGRRVLLICVASMIICVGQLHAQSNYDGFQLQSGDLLFQDSDCGPFCDAIEKVTIGYQGAKLSHVGMVIIEEDGFYVIEAGGNGVVLTELDEFLSRSFDSTGSPKVIVGRLKEELQPIVPSAIEHARKKLGASYDDAFDIANDKYYCSELIFEACEVANHGIEVFNLSPMTFIDPDSNKTFEIWEDYFQELQMTIPEGEFGLNPGSMSRSTKIDIVYKYGYPDNMVEY